MSTEELKVVLRRNENSGFGFSLLGTTGPPHVIYDIVENSPAADCGAVEAGDVILKVNGTDVHRYTTKEVLKCLRLSDDLVTLELKRDPKLKARIKEQLANTKSPHYIDIEPSNIYDYNSSGSSARRRRTASPPIGGSGGHSNYNEDAYNTNCTSVTATTNSPVSHFRCKASPHQSTHTTTTLRQQTTTKTTSSSSTAVSPTHQQHSRSSSASSAKIQIFESTTIPANNNTCASPTNRPSRIPTALKSAQKPPAQLSPQHKRPRPSQIPTKAGQVGTGTPLTSPAANGNSPVSGAPLQHSNSYSGGSTCYQQQQQRQFKEQQQSRDSYDRNSGDSEPNSAPPQPAAKAPRFEAYMMTGDLILNLSRTPQTSNLLPGHTKKVDSLRDSPIRNITTGRNAANGALAPRASGESSPTSSSSVESPSHRNTATSSDSVRKAKQRTQQSSLQQQLLQQQQRDSINNSYNNSNSGGVGGGLGDERNYRKDSITNDTLRLCEELERDDDDYDDDIDNVEDEEYEGEYDLESHEDNNHRRQCHQRHHQHYHQNRRSQQPHHHHQQQRQRRPSYEIEEAPYELEENEEDQTNYDITNIETYNSGGGYLVGPDDASDRQCLMLHCGDDDNNEDDADEDYSTSVASASASAKQRLRALKQRAVSRHKPRVVGSSGGDDAVDCTNTRAHAHHHHLYGSGGSHSGGSSSSSATVKSDGILGTNTSQDETSFSVPTSPISLSTPLIDKETANSVPTSPEPSSLGVGAVGGGDIGTHDPTSTGNVVRRHNGIVRKCDSAGFRTSKSEDHLQQIQRDGIAAVIPIDIDEDVNSSLNTLLDTRQDSEDSQGSNRDRIIWTYNAPLHQLQQQQQLLAQQENPFGAPAQHYVSGRTHNSSPHSHSQSHSSSISSSPQHSAGSPASPTSVSSSVMSSSGSKGALGTGIVLSNNNGQQKTVQQQNGNQNGTGTRGEAATSTANSMGGMVLSDPSDSDSTILVSDAAVIQRQQQHQQQTKHHQQQQQKSEHKLVIQVRGIDSSNSNSPRSAYSELKDSEDELVTTTSTDDTVVTTAIPNDGNNIVGSARDSSPPVSDDGSDVESLHSYHYSPKAVDMPSAIRLAKRLYSLDGFKKSDVSRHLSKNNDFSRAVADEYLKYFNFEQKTLDQSLREFLQQFSLSGETQERERVLVHFSKRFLDCNPGSFNSQDAVHTLTCAIMLLNTDLHGQNIGRKMTCAEFVENLAELNDGENFPKDVLKYLYQAIKTQPLEWALDDDTSDLQKQRTDNNAAGGGSTGVGGHVGIGNNPFLDLPESSTAVEYKKGYVMRKCCYDSNYKKTPFGKRSWKMFYCTLRDLVLFLHKDEHGFRKNQMSDNLHNAIRIHHALATKANDYTKKQHVFRLQTADQAEYLFQTSDSKELQSWIETINFVCAAYSAPPLEGGVGSQKRFQRPLLPSTHTKYLLKEQLESHEQQLAQLENVLTEHKKGPAPSKGLALQNYKEKENYLQYELRRYKAYVSILNAKILADQQQQIIELQQQQQLTPNNNDEQSDTFPVSGARLPIQSQQQTNSIIAQQQQQPQQQQLQQSQQQLQQSSRKKDKKK